MLLDTELNSKKIIDEDIARFIDYIKVSINHMNSVTDDILEMSTLESSQTPLVMIETNVNQLINNIVMLFGLKAKEKFITIVTEYSGNILFKLNEKKIERAISNLVNNAIKFSNAGSKIIIKALLENENLIIQIIDQGIGIDEKNFESIFDRFTRSKNIGTAGEKPVGLGLSIVKQIVEKHGGTIHFTSEKNVGTTFIVTIPKTV
jgi:signal transduction histidine kinase